MNSYTFHINFYDLAFRGAIFTGLAFAMPLAWWAMHNWLEGFADKITICWWVLVIPGLVALMIALITVSFKAFKVATANPVRSLRTD